jgi:hypothetical protein
MSTSSASHHRGSGKVKTHSLKNEIPYLWDQPRHFHGVCDSTFELDVNTVGESAESEGNIRGGVKTRLQD